MSIETMGNLGPANDGSTYIKYQELLHARREKTSRLLHGWTKEGRCQLVANEIIDRLSSHLDLDMAGTDLLIKVLKVEVLPKVNKKCKDQIIQKLDQVLPIVNERFKESRKQKQSHDLHQIFPMRGLARILENVEQDKQCDLINQLHMLFVDKLKDCKECFYTLEGIPRNQLLYFVSILNRTTITSDNAFRYIQCLKKIATYEVDGMRVISELSNMVPEKMTALMEILKLPNSADAVSNLLDILKKVPTKEQKEALIDQLYILFVNKLNKNTYLISLCILELDGILATEIANYVITLNCAHLLNYQLSAFLHDLKEIIKKNPALLGSITELFKMVPEKADALIKILKLPNSADAVSNLLDILKKVPTKEQKETLIAQIYTFFVEPYRVRVELPSLYDYLSSFQAVPENERSDFIFLLNDLLLSAKGYKFEKFDDYLQLFKKYPAEELRVIANQAKLFLANLGPRGSDRTPYEAINLLLAIPAGPTRNAFIDQIPTLIGAVPAYHSSTASVLLYCFLFPNEENKINQAMILNHHLQDLPIQQQIALLFQAQRLYVGLSPLVGNPLDAAILLKEKIPEDKREGFIAEIPNLLGEVNHLNGRANNVKLQVLLFIFQRIASVERSDFIQHLCNLRVPNIQNHLENLLALPVNERADRVEAINLQYELENAQEAALINGPLGTLIVDPADFAEETSNPTKPLLQIFEERRQRKRFPRIQYLNSEGVDLGGLTRDFVSQLFKALCHPAQKRLPLMPIDERYFPTLKEDLLEALSLEDQIKCYQAIGILFARALNGDLSLTNGSVTTGTHFHPNMFGMIHALTPDDLDLIPDPLAHDAVPDVTLKLTRFYLKTQFPQLFKPDGIQEAIVDDEIVKLMNGEVSQRLQQNGVETDFLKDYHVNSIIQAVLIIAKSMHKNLLAPIEWASTIGNSPESLRKKIEGSLTQDLVINAFGLQDEAQDTRKGMVKRWILEASPEMLKNFVFSLTGSNSLSPGQKLRVQLCTALNNPENAPVFHTCGQYMDLPQYETYEVFTAKLAISIASAMAGGFQAA